MTVRMTDGRPSAAEVLLQPGARVWIAQPDGRCRRGVFRSYGITRARTCIVEQTADDGSQLRCTVVDPISVFPLGPGEGGP